MKCRALVHLQKEKITQANLNKNVVLSGDTINEETKSQG